MLGKDALSQALIWILEGRPIVQAVSRGHDSEADDWVIVEKIDGKLSTITEIPKEPEAEAE